MRYMGGYFNDPNVPAGYRDADIAMREMRERAAEREAERRAAEDDQEDDDE